MGVDGRGYLLVAFGWMFVALALSTSLLLLPRRAHSTAVRLWTLAMLSLGLGAMLLALRDLAPRYLSYTTANVLFVSSIWLKAMALRAWAKAPLYVGRHALLAVTHGLLFQAFLMLDMPNWRSGLSQVVMGAGYGYTAWCALQVARRRRSRSAWAMVWFEGVPCVVLLVLVAARLGIGEPLVEAAVPWALIAWAAAMSMGGVLSTGGFSGIVLEDLRRAERQARDAEEREAGRREAAELHSRQLAEVAETQRQLADERARLLGLITHEVRQPLHNASGVLQALHHALERPVVPSTADLNARVQRADHVLGGVRDVLDNVLVAGLLLEENRPLALQPLELRLAFELAMLDLADTQRARVQLDIAGAPDDILAESNLLRLALRNLLRNACEHGGQTAPVTLRARLTPAGDRLLIEVCDGGAGFPPEVLQRLAEQATAGRLQLAAQGLGRGLGLQVVARVARRHGATLQLSNANEPGHTGACARLSWPLVATEALGAEAPAFTAAPAGP